MSKRKDVIREYDKVKIINPQVFIRCGYPLTIQMVKDTIITKEQKNAIWEMLKAFNVKNIPDDVRRLLHCDREEPSDIDFGKVMDVMARIVLRQQGWGGSERKIYTKVNSNLMNATGEVWNKRVVKTGHYCAGSYHQDYYNGYDDYDPPGLANEETHVILKVYVHPKYDDIDGRLLCGGEIEIEKCNVVKINETEHNIQYLRSL